MSLPVYLSVVFALAAVLAVLGVALRHRTASAGTAEARRDALVGRLAAARVSLRDLAALPVLDLPLRDGLSREAGPREAGPREAGPREVGLRDTSADTRAAPAERPRADTRRRAPAPPRPASDPLPPARP